MIKASEAQGQHINGDLIHNALTTGWVNPLPGAPCFWGRVWSSMLGCWDHGVKGNQIQTDVKIVKVDFLQELLQ